MRYGVAAVTCALLAPAVGVAAPGDHIHVGEAVLTPTLDLGLEHRTNVYRRDQRFVAGTAFRVAPGLDLSLDGPEVFVGINGEWELRKYIQSYATNLDRLNDFNLGGRVDLFRNRPLGLELRESATLRNNTVDSGGAEDPFATQLRNEAGARVKIRFGPALEVVPGFTHTFDDFRVPDGAIVGNPDRHYNTRSGLTPGLAAQWKFFPRTALVFDSSLTFFSWSENQISRLAQQPGSLSVAIPNSTHLKVKTGLRGRVSENITTTVELGYGFANYKSEGLTGSGEIAADLGGLKGLLVTAQAQYLLTPRQKFTVGYKKDFADSWFSNFMTYNHLYLKHHGAYGERVTSDVELMMRFEGYEGAVLRDDRMLRVKADGTFALQDWASTTVGLWYTQRSSTDALVAWNDINIHWLATFTY
ncbi:MAG: outer membrane beta-barrel protein [Proteobacteria bacterium]|nr:outer membrane beta-barrel protein [Pseudomonadota bacterium]